MPKPKSRPKNPAAVAMAKRRAKSLTAARRREIAQLGGIAKARNHAAKHQKKLGP